MKHKHHKIPKHIGGTDDPSNLIELSVEEHALAHKELYETHARWQDYLAWKTLSGQIGKEEAIKFAQQHADKSWSKTKEGKEKFKNGWKKRREKKLDIPWNKGKTKENSESIADQGKLTSMYMKEGKLFNIGDYARGRKQTKEHNINLRFALKNQKKKVCEYCGKLVIGAMYARWHGNKCKTLGKKV